MTSGSGLLCKSTWLGLYACGILGGLNTSHKIDRMATTTQENEIRTDLQNLLNDLTSIDIPSLARREELGSMSFEPGLPYFERLLRLYRELSKIDLGTLPYQTLAQLRDRTRETLAAFNEIRQFSFAKFPNNTQNQRDTFINSIRDRYDSDFVQISPIIAYGIRRGTDFDRLEREAKSILATMNALLEEQNKTKEETANAVQKTLEDVRRVAREAGVSQHAELFNEEAKEHAAAAAQWLIATILVASGTAIIAAGLLVVSWLYTPNDITTTRAVQMGIAKVAILSLLFSAVVWVGRMYRSHRHNYVVNRHRLNALRTFETFARAAGDDSTKNAVLIQATQCIFSPQPTGYITGEPDANPTSQVLEIVRNIGKPGA
jgi:hypothetical protein